MELKLPASVRLLVGLLCMSLLVWWMYLLRELLILLTFSVLFAMLLYPLCYRLERWRVPRTLAITACLLVALAVLVLVFFLISTQLASFAEEFPTLQHKVEAWGLNLQKWASSNLNVSRARALSELKKASSDLLKNAGQMASRTLSATTDTLTSISLIPIFVFFLLYYRDFFQQFFYKIFHRVPRTKLNRIFGKIYAVVQGYLLGLVIVIMIVGTLNTIGLLLLDIEYAVFFGFLGAFLLIIPYIGITIGSILPIFWALITKDSPMYALGVLAVFMLVQVLEGNFITPNIVGSKVSINPLAAMIALILGGQLWGLSGLVLALPVIAIIKVICDHTDGLQPYGFLLGEPSDG
jgi:predicted PurR-regulated permease PerM